jgi:hypothetical protein
MIHRHADYEHFTSTVLNNELAAWVKYTRSQAKTTLTEANHLSSYAFTKHEKAIADLNALKEKLWKSGDTAKWGITDHNIITELTHLRDDKGRAFTYMLPKASLELDKLREEAEFFTNQIFREVKRTFAIDYEIARGTAINLGEMLLRLTYQLTNGWQDVLSRYSTLNEERRLEDERLLLLAANKRPEDYLDLGFADDMKDLPMFRDAHGAPEEEVKTASGDGGKPQGGTYKGRYTVAYSKMDNDRLLQEPLLSQMNEVS